MLTTRCALCGAELASAQDTCTHEHGLRGWSAEGRVQVHGGHVAWRRFGNGSQTPLLLIHGGPGATSDYFDSLAALGVERPIYTWDQLGNGRSDKPQDASLWTLARFVEELSIVRAALGVERLHVLGHSWGGLLAMEWLVTTKPSGVQSVIFAGAPLDVPRSGDDRVTLIGQLSPASQLAIAEAVQLGDFATPGMSAVRDEYSRKHFARTRSDLQGARGYNQTILDALLGSGVIATGALKDWNRTGDLASLAMPVLFLVGEFDDCTPETNRAYAALRPGAELIVVPAAGHMTFLDNPPATLAAVRGFLSRVDAGLF